MSILGDNSSIDSTKGFNNRKFGRFDSLKFNSTGALFEIDRWETWCHLATLLHLFHVSDPDRTTPRSCHGKGVET